MPKFYYCVCGCCFGQRRFLREHLIYCAAEEDDSHRETTVDEWWNKRNERLLISED